MNGSRREDWREVCEQVSREQDPETLASLVQELNHLLEQKQRREKARSFLGARRRVLSQNKRKD